MKFQKRSRYWLPLVCGLFLSVGAIANVIGEIEIVSSNGRKCSEQAVKDMIMVRKGMMFNPETLSDDLKLLQKSGYFEEAKANVTQLESGKVKVVYYLAPANIISKITIESDGKRIKKSKIRSKVNMEIGMPVNWYAIGIDVQTIRKLYIDKEDTLTEISYRLVELDDGTVELVYVIDEHEVYLLENVLLSGNEFFSDSEIKSRMITKPKFWLWRKLFNTGLLAPMTLNIDRGQIKDMYREKGFLDCEVPRIEDNHYNQSQTETTVIFRIVEGERYKFGNVLIRGNSKFTNEQLKSNNIDGIKSFYAIHNAWVEESVINRDIEYIKRIYYNAGYADFRVEVKREIDKENKTMSIVYDIVENEISYIENIIIVGNKRTQNHVIMRELTMHPGDKVDKWQMDRDVERLYNMNYFEKVTFTSQKTVGMEGKSDLQLQVVEANTGSFSIGAGYSIDDSASIFSQWQQRNFDLFGWDNNFTGGGQDLSIRGQIGDLTSNVNISFREPWLFDYRLSLDSSLYYNTRYEETYEQDVLGTEWGLTSAFVGRWRQKMAIAFRYFDVETSSSASPYIQIEEGSDFSNTLSYMIYRNTKTPFLLPRRGSFLKAGVTYAPKFLGTYEDWIRTDLNATFYFPILNKVTFKMNFELNTIWMFDEDYLEGSGGEILNLRIFDRLFAGGQSDIRGFKRSQIGRVSPYNDKEYLGGMARLVMNFEFLWQVHKSFAFIGFIDAGNVWQRTEDIDTNLNASIGFGIQLTNPQFPIRLQYGIPFRTTYDHLEGSKGRFHFDVSTSF